MGFGAPKAIEQIQVKFGNFFGELWGDAIAFTSVVFSKQHLTKSASQCTFNLQTLPNTICI